LWHHLQGTPLGLWQLQQKEKVRRQVVVESVSRQRLPSMKPM
jgi:hypothetical protein